MQTKNTFLEQCYQQQKMLRHWDLENMYVLLEKLGNPQQKLKCIHITGTNGKGSTVAFLQHILIEAGYKVGVYTSPHLVKINERIKINETMIADQELNEYIKKIRSITAEDTMTYSFFEIITAIAFCYFADKKVDIVIIETGLGGKLDATNVCNSIITAITSVAIEHTFHLGNTIKEIAENKAGIIKKNQICIIPEQGIPAVAKTVIEEKCREQKTAVIIAKKTTLPLSLTGEFQQYNAGIAVEIAKQLKNNGCSITDNAIVEGLQTTVWPGRLEWLAENILVDAAHNPHAMEAVVPELEKIKHQFKKTTFVFGVLADKNYPTMIDILLPIIKKTDTLIITEPPSDRACSTHILGNIMVTKQQQYEQETDMNILWKTIKEKPKDELCIILGSIYLIGKMKEFVEKE